MGRVEDSWKPFCRFPESSVARFVTLTGNCSKRNTEGIRGAERAGELPRVDSSTRSAQHKCSAAQGHLSTRAAQHKGSAAQGQHNTRAAQHRGSTAQGHLSTP
eukprot:gene19503-biopygen10039